MALGRVVLSREHRAAGAEAGGIDIRRGRIPRNAVSQWDAVRHVRPRHEVHRRRIVDEERLHRRGHQVELVHGRQTENLLDRTGHVDLRVEGAIFGYASPGAIGVHLLLDVGADDIAWAAVTVDVVDAVLRVVFFDEDRRRGPNATVADGVDKAAKRQVVIGLHRCRVRRATGVVGADPYEFQLGYLTGRHVILEILIPDVKAILVGDAQIELRVVRDRIVDQVRERGDRADGVVVLE